MTSPRQYWCPKTMKRRPCWCPKRVLWELNSFLMETLYFVLINFHRCWSREWKQSIGPVNCILQLVFGQIIHPVTQCMRAFYIPALESQYFKQSLESTMFFTPSQLYLAILGLHSLTRVIGPPPPLEHLLHSPSLAFQSPNVTKYSTEKETSYTPLKASWDSDRKEGVRIPMNGCRTRITKFLY